MKMHVGIGLFALFVLSGMAGCESIAGIEDRFLDTDAGAPDAPANPPDSQICKDYCDEALANCTGDNALYFGATPAVQRSVCLATCALMDEGQVIEPDGNTVACRFNQARLAGMGEPSFYCPRASPGGNGECGDDCESYCSLFAKACPDDTTENCEEKCKALPDDDTYDANFHHDGDTLQCRLVHTSSATVDPEGHCWHAVLNPQPDSPCDDPSDVEPKCEDYCRLVDIACPEELAVYESTEQCLAVCEALERGFGGQTVEDTVACRRYHAYNALVVGAEEHCPHASPSGDGHCGQTNCAPYCQLLERACPDEFEGEFSSAAACESACEDIEGAGKNTGYTAETAKTGDTVQCRLLHVSRALLDDSECDAAMGGGACQ